MANAQRLASGFPFPVYVNETETKQRIGPGGYVNETIAAAAGGSTDVVPLWQSIGLGGMTAYGLGAP